MPRHCRQVWGSAPARRGALTWRIQGWVLLVVALVPCIVLEGPSVGIVAWTGVLTVAALVVTMLLTYRPRIVSVVACAAPLFAVLILAIAHVTCISHATPLAVGRERSGSMHTTSARRSANPAGVAPIGRDGSAADERAEPVEVVQHDRHPVDLHVR